jgi:predicted secreted protein
MNILQKAHEIVYDRKEEKERMYGSFTEGMKRAAEIASACTGKVITAEDMYMCMVALKLSRESYSHKEDNLLDAIAYLAALNNHINEGK